MENKYDMQIDEVINLISINRPKRVVVEQNKVINPIETNNNLKGNIFKEYNEMNHIDPQNKYDRQIDEVLTLISVNRRPKKIVSKTKAVVLYEKANMDSKENTNDKYDRQIDEVISLISKKKKTNSNTGEKQVLKQHSTKQKISKYDTIKKELQDKIIKKAKHINIINKKRSLKNIKELLTTLILVSKAEALDKNPSLRLKR